MTFARLVCLATILPIADTSSEAMALPIGPVIPRVATTSSAQAWLIIGALVSKRACSALERLSRDFCSVFGISFCTWVDSVFMALDVVLGGVLAERIAAVGCGPERSGVAS